MEKLKMEQWMGGSAVNPLIHVFFMAMFEDCCAMQLGCLEIPKLLARYPLTGLDLEHS